MTNRNNIAIGALASGLAVLAGGLLPSTALAEAPADRHFNIEVIINILKDSGVTQAEAEKYVEVANKALKCAKINLQIIETNTNVEIGNDDGSFSSDEFGEARRSGINELNDGARGAQKGKGLKIYFADEAWEDDPATPATDESRTNGWAWTCQPIITVEEVDGDTREDETGNILAHEVGHALGIPGVSGSTDELDGDYTDADRKDELMNGWSSRDCDGQRTVRGTELTEAQKTQMRCKAGQRGTAVEKPDAATPAQRSTVEQSGEVLNPSDAAFAGAPGIRQVEIFANDFDPCFEVTLITRGPFDPGGFAQYSLAFDIDNNPDTGQAFGPLQGADRLVDVVVEGQFVFGQGFDLVDPAAPPEFLEIDLGQSSLVNQGVEDTLMLDLPDGEVLSLCVPRQWLGVAPDLADIIPVFAVGFDAFGPTDELPFELDLFRGLRGPELLAPPQIDPGLPLPPLPIQGSGFEPGADIRVAIAELGLEAFVPVLPDGGFTFDLPLPPILPPVPFDFVYVTALDPGSGQTAFTVIDIAGGPMPCNAADLVAPFGVLDLSDLDAFVIAFTSGDSLADVAAPFGTLDLADIDTFINAFNAGCP